MSVEYKEVSVSVPKETYELAEGLANVTGAVKAALADGWDPLTDVPAVVMGALQHLAPAVQGVDKLDDEAKADPAGFSKALALGIADAVDKALKKEV